MSASIADKIKLASEPRGPLASISNLLGATSVYDSKKASQCQEPNKNNGS